MAADPVLHPSAAQGGPLNDLPPLLKNVAASACFPELHRGCYVVREVATEAEMAAVRRVRAQAFGVAAAGMPDPFDVQCHQVAVIDQASGDIVAAFRVGLMTGSGCRKSYAASFYGLTALAAMDGLLLELGRFCIDPTRQDPDILRAAWAALTAFVDRYDVQFLFGCSSFAGTETEPYQDAFALLRARHLGKAQWLPDVKAPEVYRFAADLTTPLAPRAAMRQMPPLLKTYLMMGGWVSDHAVIDRQMNTLHVFTGLRISAIPASRKRLLRAMV